LSRANIALLRTNEPELQHHTTHNEVRPDTPEAADDSSSKCNSLDDCDDEWDAEDPDGDPIDNDFADDYWGQVDWEPNIQYVGSD
jgi:hypothetical protein